VTQRTVLIKITPFGVLLPKNVVLRPNLIMMVMVPAGVLFQTVPPLDMHVNIVGRISEHAISLNKKSDFIIGFFV
jgi:hypothetical protein